jgi:hypothetical protein
MEAAVSTTMSSSTAGVTWPVSPKVSRASARRRPRGHLDHVRVLVCAAVLYHTQRREVSATCVCWCALQCYITREVVATRVRLSETVRATRAQHPPPPPVRLHRGYMTQPLVEMYEGCMVVLKVS